VCGKIHLADDNFPKPGPRGHAILRLPLQFTQRAIVIGIDAWKHLWHALGRGGIKVGDGTGVHAEIRRWRPADFAE
jgi:hypothetical protein